MREVEQQRVVEKARKTKAKHQRVNTKRNMAQELNDYIAIHGHVPPQTATGPYKAIGAMWHGMKQDDIYLPLKKTLRMKNQWPALSSAWIVHDDLEKKKNIVLTELEAMALLRDGIANPMNLVVRVGRTDSSSIDMSRIRAFFDQNPTFQVVLDKRIFPMAVEGKSSNTTVGTQNNEK